MMYLLLSYGLTLVGLLSLYIYSSLQVKSLYQKGQSLGEAKKQPGIADET